MYKVKKSKVNIGMTSIVVIVAAIFFIAVKTTIEKDNEINRVSNVNSTYQASQGYINWNGHKWYAEQAALAAHNDTSLSIKHEEITEAIMVNVLTKEDNKVESLPLEEYVLAVTLNELPWQFKDEAIKAQMVAARTYIMYRLKRTDESERQYDVTNTTKHQVFKPIDEAALTEQQSSRYKELKVLLEETKGKILTYNGQPIDALYFSTSNGRTEAGKDYFGTEYPYLQSVSSKWDIAISTSYEKQFQFSYTDFLNRLKEVGLLDKKQKNIKIEVVERTESNRIKTIKINNVLMTAKQLREALGIASTDFTWQLDNKNSIITLQTRGFGHGVGMSQWGAEGMAREGYTFEQILKHYYTNIEIESL